MSGFAEATVTLPEDVVIKARRFAERRHCSTEALVTEAVRNYMGINESADPRIQAALQEAWDLGLTPDEYAVKAVNEVREQMRPHTQSSHSDRP